MKQNEFRVLVIEPNSYHAELLLSALEYHFTDWQIDHASTLEQAFKWIKNKRYMLILTDVDFEDYSGEEYISLISAQVTETPIIIITSHASEKYVARCIQAGAEDYIIKTRDSLEAIPKIIARNMVKYERQDSRHKRKRQISSIIETGTEALLNKFETIQKSLKRMGSDSDSKSGLDQIYDQVKGLKEMMWKVVGPKD